MRHHNFGRTVGLSLIGALSLLSFSAVSAQAGQFKVNGLTNLLALLTGQQLGESLLLIPGRNLTLKCKVGTFETGSEIINGSEALAKIDFSQCLAFQHKSPFNQIECTIDNPLVIAKILPALHPANHPLVLIEPDAPATLFTILLLLGEKCPLPEENPVKGTLVALVDKNDTSEPQLLFTHALQALAETALGDKVLFGGFPASLQATVDILAIGTHKDFLLAVL
jgi:hypothetical protein